jgi:hypothetical protein
VRCFGPTIELTNPWENGYAKPIQADVRTPVEETPEAQALPVHHPRPKEQARNASATSRNSLAGDGLSELDRFLLLHGMGKGKGMVLHEY